MQLLQFIVNIFTVSVYFQVTLNYLTFSVTTLLKCISFFTFNFVIVRSYILFLDMVWMLHYIVVIFCQLSWKNSHNMEKKLIFTHVVIISSVLLSSISSGIIFLLPKGSLLTFLVLEVWWWRILSTFMPEKVFISPSPWKAFSLYKETDFFFFLYFKDAAAPNSCLHYFRQEICCYSYLWSSVFYVFVFFFILMLLRFSHYHCFKQFYYLVPWYSFFHTSCTELRRYVGS